MREIKNDQMKIKLLYLSCCIKWRSDASALTVVSIHRVMQITGMSFKVSKEVLEAAKKDNQMFRYNSHTNKMTCCNLKKKYTEVKRNKNGKYVKTLNAVKLDLSNINNLKDFKRWFYQTLFLQKVNGAERNDELTLEGKKTKNVSSKSGLCMSYKNIGKAIGLSKSAAHRMVNRMGEKITKDPAEYLVSEDGEDSHFFSCKSNRYIHVTPCIYHSKDVGIRGMFQHIILFHKRRLTTVGRSVQRAADTIVNGVNVDMYYSRQFGFGM